MRRILVVGGAGYIGSHVCKALAAIGLEPIVFDNLSRGRRKAVKWGPLLVGDVLDRDSLDEAFAEWRPEAVIHFAGLAYVSESTEQPARYYLNNTAGTLVLLDAMRSANVTRLVFSSTCAVYGIPSITPISEGVEPQPISPYGRSKLMAEQMIEDHYRAYGISAACLRYFNACGLDKSGELGVWHEPETRLIPRALMAAAGRISALDVFGDDYATPDGTCIRDYIHVTDLAEGHVRAVQRLLGAKDPELLRLNLGSGAGLSVRQVLDSIEELTGRRVPYSVRKRREGDPPELVADPTMAAAVLGFRTSQSDIGSIILSSWPFFRDRQSLTDEDPSERVLSGALNLYAK